MSELGKPFKKNSDKKKQNKINVKRPHLNKKQLERNGTLEKTRTRMNYEWMGKTI